MADASSPLLALLLQETGGNNNLWGEKLNTDVITLIENAIAGRSEITITGAGTTLTAGQRRSAILDFSGVLTGNEIITVSDLSKQWLVYNGTTGAFTLKFKTASGSASTAVRQGGWSHVWCDGEGVCRVGVSTAELLTQLQAADGTVSLPALSAAAEPSSGIRRAGAGDWRFTILGVDVLKITAAGLDLVTGIVTRAGNLLTPIAAETDYAGIDEPNGWAFMYGQSVSRTTYASLLAVITKTTTATTTNASPTLTVVAVDLRNKGLIGAKIEGTGIPSGTTITAIAATTITLSANATGSGSLVAIRILPHGNGDGSTTFNIPDARDRVTAGRGDMGGTAAGRLTDQTGGVDGTKLVDVGGTETHTLTGAQLPADVSGTAGITISDPGHKHLLVADVSIGSTQGGLTNANQIARSSGSGGDGATIHSGTSSAADVGLSATATTGITAAISALGGGAAHNNVQPTRISNRIIFTGVYS